MKRVLSVIIVLCLLATATINILATSNNNDASDGYNDYDTIEKKDYELEIAEKKKSSNEFEVVSLREECVKHFAQKDGTIKAIVYPFPVHFLSEDDKWEDLYDYDRSVPLTAERFESLRDGNNYSVNGYEDYDTYISQYFPTTNYESVSNLIVGDGQIAYYYCTNPELPELATVVSSSVSYYFWFNQGIDSGSIFVGVYEAINYWDSFDLTYNNSGLNNGLSSTCCCYKYMIASSTISSTTPKNCSFDITELTKEWYAGHSNYGIGIKRVSGSLSSVNIYSNNNNHHWPVYSVIYSLESIIAENGTYLLNNPTNLKSIQIDPSVNYNQNQATMKLCNLDYDDNRQKWEFVYLNNGYYRIISKASNKSLAVVNGGEGTNGSSIVQESYTASNRQQWSLSVSQSGYVIIRPKSSNSFPNTDFSISSVTNQLDIVQYAYVNDSILTDEWTMMKLVETNTPLEGQANSNWCWVASARMFSRNYSSCVQASQLDGATHIFPTDPYQGGSMVNILTLVHYYTSMNNNQLPLDTFSQYIYSQEILLQFIDDGNPVIISIGDYNTSNLITPFNEHVEVIYGYLYNVVEETYQFLIRDPWPVNFGRTYCSDYDSIVYSIVIEGNHTYYKIWNACVFKETSYSGNKVPYYPYNNQ